MKLTNNNLSESGVTLLWKMSLSNMFERPKSIYEKYTGDKILHMKFKHSNLDCGVTIRSRKVGSKIAWYIDNDSPYNRLHLKGRNGYWGYYFHLYSSFSRAFTDFIKKYESGKIFV